MGLLCPHSLSNPSGYISSRAFVARTPCGYHSLLESPFYNAEPWQERRFGLMTALPGLHLIYLNRELEQEQCLPLPEARRLCPPEQQSRPHLPGPQIISWHGDLIGFFKGLCSVFFREPGVLAASSPELLRRQMALKGIVYPSWPRWQSSLGEGRKGRLQHCLTQTESTQGQDLALTG